MARYEYDAWGVCKTTQNNSADIANVNPFRYRGYYYDVETSLYYLQSRYYYPVMGRFVNGDEIVTILLSKNICSMQSNLFIYCQNNTINVVDPYGFAPKSSEVPPASSGYVPPKGGPVQKKRGNRKGWLDNNGNIWIPDHSDHGTNRGNGDKDHWDVTAPDGSYVNVGRDGHAWGGKGRVNLPKESRTKIEYGKWVGEIFIILFLGIMLFYVVSRIISAMMPLCFA